MTRKPTAPSASGLDILNLLIVDDEPNIRRTMTLHLEGCGHRVTAVAGAEEARQAVAARPFDVAFVDLRLGLESGLDLLPRLRTAAPGLKIVVITAYASVETAVEAMRRGATDYLAKPFTPPQLDLVLEKLAGVERLERRLQALEGNAAQTDPEAELTSASPAMRQVLDLARRVADGDARLLLRGESGTGKGVLARAIHAWSQRRERPFVVVSCPALPAELLESELFGHVRGSFTGATRDSVGRIAIAQGGTLLLDEIGDLPPALQPKLLRFVQDREYERIGDPTTRHADVRLLAATNRDLEQAVAEGRFREDLLYRLNVVTLEVPPLRDRREDILPLADAFLAFLGSRNHHPGLHFTAAARAALQAHPWPGNVRELRNAIERATMLVQGFEVAPDLLHLASSAQRATSGPSLGDPVPLAAIEREHVRRVVAQAPSLKEAATILEIDPATLWRWRKQQDL